MKKIALVDFDGVVLKSNEANRYINYKVERFVMKKLKVKDVRLNNELYCGYGHTVLALKSMGIKTCLSEFNEEVYGNPCEYQGLKLSKEEKKNWAHFVSEMKKINVGIKLFSNADKRWILNFIDYDSKYYSFQDEISSYN